MIGVDGNWNRRTMLAGLAGLAATSAFAQQAGAAGEVSSLTGEVMAELRDRVRALAQGAPVFVGDQVATAKDSRASLQLGRDTLLKLSDRARVTIDRYLVEAGGTITLGSGAVLIDKTPRPGGERLRLRSAYGVIAVRGTQFFAGPSNGVFGVLVTRGRVSVTAAGREVIVSGGEGTDIPAPGRPPTPPQRWGQARIDDALARFG